MSSHKMTWGKVWSKYKLCLKNAACELLDACWSKVVASASILVYTWLGRFWTDFEWVWFGVARTIRRCDREYGSMWDGAMVPLVPDWQFALQKQYRHSVEDQLERPNLLVNWQPKCRITCLYTVALAVSTPTYHARHWWRRLTEWRLPMVYVFGTHFDTPHCGVYGVHLHACPCHLPTIAIA